MDRLRELLGLEHAGWRALATDGETAAAFYDEVLASDVLMLLPGGMVIDDRTQVVESMRGPAWDSFQLTDERVIDLTPNSAVVTYRATASRDAPTTRRCSTAHMCAKAARGG